MTLDRTAYLFLSGSIGREGGIASIVIRTTGYLAENGVRCAALTFGDIPDNKLHPDVLAIPGHETGFRAACRQISDKFSGCDEIVVVSFDPKTAAYGLLMSSYLRMRRIAGSVTFCIDLLHPREFFPHFENSRTHRLNTMLASSIGPENFAYMNEPVQRSHEAFWQWPHSQPTVLPVPMDARPARWTPQERPDGALRICSVGRIVAFKSYNFETVAITEELADRGKESSWDIFGYGDDEDRLQNILKTQAKDRVRLKGELPLKEFDTTVPQYDVFVGMGLSAIQAAQLGVPTILAVETCGDTSYGWLENVPFGIVGENIDGVERQRIVDVLDNFTAMTAAEKTALSKRQIAAANRYGMEGYVEAHPALRRASARGAAASCRHRLSADQLLGREADGQGASFPKGARRRIARPSASSFPTMLTRADFHYGKAASAFPRGGWTGE